MIFCSISVIVFQLLKKKSKQKQANKQTKSTTQSASLQNPQPPHETP